MDNLQETLDVLNTNNYSSCMKIFEDERGYEKYLKNCQQLFNGSIEDSFYDMKKMKFLSKPVCEKIKELIDYQSEVLNEHDFRLNLMGEILNKNDIDSALKSYFKSEYTPIWCRFYKNEPGKFKNDYSYYWHCDGGPSKHLKALIYLDSTDVTDGRTLVLDRWATQEFKNIGYVFCPLEQRLSDLSELADIHGIGYKEIKYDFEAGEGIMFEPAHILHKGIWPEKSPRYLLQICFIASGRPWFEVCPETGCPVNDNGWPKVN